MAIYYRLLRADLIATLQEDYVTMARAKGLSTRYILLRHALRPSSFALLAGAGLSIGALFTGAFVVEILFQLPGHRRSSSSHAIYSRDYLVVQGMALVAAVAFVVINFAVDFLLTFLDPGSAVAELTSDRARGLRATVERGRAGTMSCAGPSTRSRPPVAPRRARAAWASSFWICLGWVALMILLAVFASVLPLKPPNFQDYSAVNVGPSIHHLLGTDDLGRDLLSRIIYGSRVSLVIGFASVAIALVIGGRPRPPGRLPRRRRRHRRSTPVPRHPGLPRPAGHHGHRGLLEAARRCSS